MKYFDLHCDTPTRCFRENQRFFSNTLDISGEKGKCFEKWVQTFAVWINEEEKTPWQFYLDVLKDFKEKLKEAPDNLTPVFAVEGGALIENDIDRLYIMKRDEIRFLTLTWNGANTIGGGVKTDKDLTDFGKDVIRKMNKLSIGCDLSHINRKGFYKAIEIAEKPLATHANCYELCNHPRNLDLTQISLIAEKGGIIGLCMYPEFLADGDVFQRLYENICLLCDKGFENNIAMGSDFDGADMDKKLNNISKVPNFYRFLEEKNLGKELLDKIFYNNAEKFLENL